MATLVFSCILAACAMVPASDSQLAELPLRNCVQVLDRDEISWCLRGERGPRFFLVRQVAGGVSEVSEALPIGRIEVPAMVETLEYGFGSLWLSYSGRPMRVLRIDPQSLAIQARIDVETDEPSRSGAKGEIAVGRKAVWVISNGLLYEIDPTSTRIVSQLVVPYAISIAANDGVVWLAHSEGVLTIDEASLNVVQTYPLPEGTHVSTRLTGRGSNSRIDVSGQTVRVPLAVTRTGFLSCRSNCYPTLVGMLDPESGRFVADGD